MPRLLIVSPHFPPVNAPDMQRVRMSLPHWLAAGWEVTVLTADDPTPTAPHEPALLGTIPPAVRVLRCRTFSRRWTGPLGVNNLGWRVLPFLALAGSRLLRRERFDAVYFSTTQFIVCPLGRLWRAWFGVPFVLDLQDPWLNDYYARTGTRPPGGWKYRFARLWARLLEGWTLRRCDHVISVSPPYLDALARRYPWFDRSRATVLPFGTPDDDLALVRQEATPVRRILPDSPHLRIAYAGRLGPDMQPALEVLIAALALLRREAGPRCELYFFGTSYAASGTGRSSTDELATRHNLKDSIHEHPARVGYLESLRLLLDTDLALILGSDDPAYSPSKIYPTLLAGRPTLAVAPAGSVAATLLQRLGGSHVVEFGADRAEAAVRLAAALRQLASSRTPSGLSPERAESLRAHSAAAVADAQARILATVIRSSQRDPH